MDVGPVDYNVSVPENSRQLLLIAHPILLILWPVRHGVPSQGIRGSRRYSVGVRDLLRSTSAGQLTVNGKTREERTLVICNINILATVHRGQGDHAWGFLVPPKAA